jgi:dTDP-4-dehydrorhamnose 3,5-epimerase
MGRLSFAATPIAGVLVVERSQIEDQRGFLSRLYCSAEFRDAGWKPPIAQINLSSTRLSGTVRGMHVQVAPDAEDKLVTCMRGEIFDVAVDLRRGSPTFLQWYGVKLSASGRRSLLIPRGCAHGYQTLADDCELLYMHSAPHVPASELGVNPQDRRIGIAWPLPISAISDRDGSHPMLSAEFAGIEF